jgi:Leucine-rich repeat (LRR) protein
MKRVFILAALMCVIILSSCRRFDPPTSGLPDVVSTPSGQLIPDGNLESTICTSLNITSSQLTSAELANVNSLYLTNVVDFTGLSLCVNMTSLHIIANGKNVLLFLPSFKHLTYLAIENSGLTTADLPNITGLTTLVTLSFNNNSIGDISSLSGLVNLTGLFLDVNAITSLSVVQNMPKISTIQVNHDMLTSLSGLENRTHLGTLGASYNHISDVSALSGDTAVSYLDLSHNNITDISALATNATNGGIGTGDNVYLSANPLNAAPDVSAYIPLMKSKGANVVYP